MTNNDLEIIWLKDRRCLNSKLVGNKGANLARLRSLQYNVPDGFCIAANVAGSITKNPEELKRALKHLGFPVAVRSSSTAEDAKNLAFAGLFTSVLGLNSETGAIRAVRKVVDSKSSSKAMHYARQRGIKLGKMGMGIIIQRLINPDYSGVAFSRHPVTNQDVVVIESTYGLCDTLVDGSVTPDYMEIAKNGSINKIKIGAKKIKSVFKNNKVIRTKATKSERESLAIPKNTAKKLAGIVRKIERDFGSPQDIEWAVSGKTIYILQARPITTVK